MEEKLRERAKSKKLRVIFPNGDIICYTSAKETFLETLRKIDANKLKTVKLEVCHLPIFSQTVYPRYKDFMEPVADGLYVNTQGNTYNKYVYLKIISDQLKLRLDVQMSEDFVAQKMHKGTKGLCVLEVTFPDGEIIGEVNTGETFMQCIWKLGIDKVRNLNLKQGGKDLITFSKLYNNQVQVNVDRWLIVPSSLKDKVKLLKVISAMLHIKLKIDSFSENERKTYRRIGPRFNFNKNVNEIANSLGGIQKKNNKFNKGDIVYSDLFGEGKVVKYDEKEQQYLVWFYNTCLDLDKKYQYRKVYEIQILPVKK
jgi:hypothetical protein